MLFQHFWTWNLIIYRVEQIAGVNVFNFRILNILEIHFIQKKCLSVREVLWRTIHIFNISLFFWKIVFRICFYINEILGGLHKVAELYFCTLLKSFLQILY